MLLPNSSFQKYTKMVAGLLLITVILTPVFKLVKSDLEDVIASVNLEYSSEKNMENSIEMQKTEIQASLDEYTLDKLAVQLKEDANKELMAAYGVEIESITLFVDEQSEKSFPDNIAELELVVNKSEVEEEQNAVEVVKSIDINTQQPLPPDNEVDQIDRASLTSFLAENWGVEEEVINILIEGGEVDPNG